MTEAQMREAMSGAFVAGWRARMPGVGLALEDELGKLPGVGAGGFALLTITVLGATQRTQGGRGIRRVERRAVAQVKLWSPTDAGAGALADLADAARATLEMITVPSPVAGDESITTQASSSLEPAIDGRWYMSAVRVPFWYAETK